MYPTSSQYTWRRRSPVIKCRLDYFLVSSQLVNVTKETDIKPGFRTDHSLITINILENNQNRGRGFWKLNTSLLLDNSYTDKIKKSIRESYVLYKEQQTNPCLIWELVKADIRGESIKFASFKKKERANRLCELENELKKAHETYDKNTNTDELEKIDRLEAEIKTIIEVENRGASIRAKAQWLAEGEKSNKFFHGLEKIKYNQKIISRLIDEENREISHASDILSAEKHFFEKLYSSSLEEGNQSIWENFFPNERKTISDDIKSDFDRDININEIKEAVKRMKNEKSPGIDGFPVEFYKIFWNEIKDMLLELYQYSIDTGSLSISQKQGIITLLPKSDKDLSYLKNWRPITLLTVDYKILSSVLAMRLKSNLSDIIHEDQTGFIKNRQMSENIRKVIEIIDYLELEDLPGLIMTIDFEKAFDKIEWKFIFKTLEYFNFGERYIRYVKLLYNDSSSCCINNGWSSEFFHLGRGVRQGCPLSPYLFILCAEILGNAIRNDESVRGIQIKNDNSEVTTKLSQYADDTTLFLDGQPQSIIAVVQLCKEFEQISGLKINESKTKAACVGNLYYQYDEKFTKLDWVSEKIHLLGMDIPIKSDVKKLIDWNLRSKLKESKSVFNKWKRHKLTLYGKSMVIKSYGGSALSFFLSVVPTPDETFFNEYNDIMKDFLWDSSSTKIKIETLYKDYEEGGIRLLDLKAFDQSLKLKWLKYLHGNNTKSLHILMSRYIIKVPSGTVVVTHLFVKKY